jgi:RNA polymerase sigma factor (TIGR02999 family)
MNSASPSSDQLTRNLKDWSGGDASALERLTPVVYAELYRLARLNMAAERDGHLLQPSALVNEAFVRLIADEPIDWASRAHFFGHAARLMRHILIDFARAQDTDKRGKRNPHLDVSGIKEAGFVRPAPVDFLDLDAALNELAELDARQCRVVELRYFGGLEHGEVATILGVSEPTVRRDWRLARTWLFTRLQPLENGL